MTEPKKRPSLSDRPVEDLKKERDAFIQQFFRKGAQFTEELLKENERLRDNQTLLEAENTRLRSQLASDNAIRELLDKIETLEAEKSALLNRTGKMSEQTDEYSSRQTEVEEELANLANLYVATSQLHAAHSVRNVLRNLKERLAQLLGAQSFAVFLHDADKDELVSVACEGTDPAGLARISSSEGPIGVAFELSEVKTSDGEDTTEGTISKPAVVIPMFLDGRTLGVITIFRTLPQKTGFSSADWEMFKLLGAQAAPALVNARLFCDAGRNAPGVQSFLDLEDMP